MVVGGGAVVVGAGVVVGGDVVVGAGVVVGGGLHDPICSKKASAAVKRLVFSSPPIIIAYLPLANALSTTSVSPVLAAQSTVDFPAVTSSAVRTLATGPPSKIKL